MDPVFFLDGHAFRKWLEDNHASADELLMGFSKKETGKGSIDWPTARDEALCFGWIDGIRKSLGDDSYAIPFTSRRSGSIWSKVTKAVLHWVTSAKRPETRSKRLAALMKSSAAGDKIPGYDIGTKK